MDPGAKRSLSGTGHVHVQREFSYYGAWIQLCGSHWKLDSREFWAFVFGLLYTVKLLPDDHSHSLQVTVCQRLKTERGELHEPTSNELLITEYTCPHPWGRIPGPGPKPVVQLGSVGTVSSCSKMIGILPNYRRIR